MSGVFFQTVRSTRKPLPLVFVPLLPLPKGRVGQVWHERTHASAAHAWLRKQVSEAAAQLEE